jgi:hypothetical protein
MNEERGLYGVIWGDTKDVVSIIKSGQRRGDVQFLLHHIVFLAGGQRLGSKSEGNRGRRIGMISEEAKFMLCIKKSANWDVLNQCHKWIPHWKQAEFC